MTFGGLSPKQGHLGRLLELAAGIGFENKSNNPKEEALMHTLLTICTRRYNRHGPCSAISALGGGDVTIPLLHLCSSTTGVTQSLSLQALKTWIEDHSDCAQICIKSSAIPLLLSVLASSLPASESDVAAAYAASLVVIILRALVREGGEESAERLIAANGVESLLELLARLQHDSRSVCLILYLLNDVTRRSSEILDRAIACNALHYIVAVLRQPVSESTKFAALILNRWSLAAQHVPLIRAAESVDALMSVLEICYQTPQLPPSIDSETVAYALSALSIMTQDITDTVVYDKLLESPSALNAVSRAIEAYEKCFKGVGFPHAMMCVLLDGPKGATLIAALGARGLLPLWLSARHVGTQLAERAAQQDTLSAMTSITDLEESLQTTIALTHLLHRAPLPQFYEAVLEEGKLERLAWGAICEIIDQKERNSYSVPPCSSSLSVCAPVTPPPHGDSTHPPPLRPSPSSEGIIHFHEGKHNGINAHGNTSAQNNELEFSIALDPIPAVVTDPRPLPPSTAVLPPSPFACATTDSHTVSSIITATTTTGNTCVSALSRLSSMISDYTTTAKSAAAAACTPLMQGIDAELQSMSPTKRQRVDQDYEFNKSQTHPILFRKEDVGVQRYDTLCFVVGNREVHAVGFILEAHSCFLRGLLSTVDHVGEKVIVPQLPAFSPDRMHSLFLEMVEWAYTGHVEGIRDPEDAFDLWALAEFFQIDGLQRYLESVLQTMWFGARLDVLIHSLKLAETYASAEPLKRRVARVVLNLLVDTMHSREMSEELVVAAAAAGHAQSLSMAMAAEMRHRLQHTSCCC